MANPAAAFGWILANLLLPGPVLGLPASIDSTGLYQDSGLQQVASANLPYEPQYPLWSDGAQKRRWIFLPNGARIDTQDINAWSFPVGTKLWKEFSLPDPASPSSYRRIETRYMEKTDDGWVFATYLWKPDGTTAVMAPEDGIDNYYPLRDGHAYRVPGTFECTSCHSGGQDPVLGFSALQLSPTRDVALVNAASVDLRKLADRGLLTEPLVHDPVIHSLIPAERQAIGYLHGNCAGCHRAGGIAQFSGMYLDVDVNETSASGLNVYKTAVDRLSNFPIPGYERSSYRIKPGHPEQSAVLYRLDAEAAGAQMPPFGRSTHDASTVKAMRDWISGL